MHRNGTQTAHDRAAVRASGARTKHVVLPADWRIGREPGVHACDRRAVFADAVLRQPQALGSAGSEPQCIQRLMRVMGIEVIYPKRRTTRPGPDTKFTRIYCGMWRSRGPTRCGPATSPTCRCVTGFCTSRR